MNRHFVMIDIDSMNVARCNVGKCGPGKPSWPCTGQWIETRIETMHGKVWKIQTIWTQCMIYGAHRIGSRGKRSTEYAKIIHHTSSTWHVTPKIQLNSLAIEHEG